MPAVFYFALSGKESLFTDPFNQFATFLDGSKVRVFSSTLPLHGPGLKNELAIIRWIEAIQKGENIFFDFIDQCKENLCYLLEQGVIDETKIAAAGLSRGGFVATHFAAREPRIQTIVGFSPMTSFEPFKEINLIGTESYSLENTIELLISKNLCFYIGNHDTRVSTSACFHFIDKLTEKAYASGVRSPQVELHLFPSIGHKGHGTPPSIFQAGANWLKAQVLRP